MRKVDLESNFHFQHFSIGSFSDPLIEHNDENRLITKFRVRVSIILLYINI